jgi:hypothetical protein
MHFLGQVGFFFLGRRHALLETILRQKLAVKNAFCIRGDWKIVRHVRRSDRRQRTGRIELRSFLRERRPANASAGTGNFSTRKSLRRLFEPGVLANFAAAPISGTRSDLAARRP